MLDIINANSAILVHYMMIPAASPSGHSGVIHSRPTIAQCKFYMPNGPLMAQMQTLGHVRVDLPAK